MKKLVSQNFGFSLIEVMIALTLFAVFVSAYLVSQGYNVTDASLNQEQLILHELCEQKINEYYYNPPTFNNTQENLKETKAFENKEFSNYSYTIEMKRLKVPDFAKIFASKNQGSDAEDSESKYFDEDNASRNKSFETIVFNKMKENVEKIIWQVRVTVTNKETKYSYSLSSWLTNYNEPLDVNIGM
jgi:prepilin-type N-terminal cleavage/methylation domain-containing protein